MPNQLLVTLTGTDNPYLKPRLPLVGMLELFEIGTHGLLISAVFRTRLTDAERADGIVKAEFGAPVEVKNPVFTYGATPRPGAPARRLESLHLHIHDQTLSFTPAVGKVVVRIEPDRPLDYGYQEAAVVIEPDQMETLRHWAATGVALERPEVSRG